LSQYAWPGNVRELQNVVHHVLLLSNRDQIGPGDLPGDMGGRPGVGSIRLEDLEREHILRILKQLDGDRSKAAEALGVHPRTLMRKLTSYGIAS